MPKANPKAAGQARKAETAASKRAAEEAKKAAEEDAKWSKGAKSGNSKQEEAAAKKAEAARKKQEREAQLAEENSSARAAPKNAKSAASKKVSKGTLDLGKLSGDADADDGKPKKAAALNASGVENALDALSLTKDASTTKIERHPERRFAAAYRAYEERRLPEIEVEHPGLRKNQRVNICRDEFKKHPDNPFNQVKVSYDATQEEVKEAREAHREAVEKNLR